MKSGASAPPRGRPLATQPEHDDRYTDMGRLLITRLGRHRAGAPGRQLRPGEVARRYR